MARPRSPEQLSDTSGPTGPVPEENQPGHHPDHEQDKPGPEVLAEKFGHVDPPGDQESSERPAAPVAVAHRALEAAEPLARRGAGLLGRSARAVSRVADGLARRADRWAGDRPATEDQRSTKSSGSGSRVQDQ